MFLDQLPERDAALPAVEDCLVYREPSRQVVENPLQLQLLEVWQKLLGIAHIEVTENFFDLGGHSLLAAAMLTQLQEVFEISLPLSSVFEAPTIEQLAMIVEQALLAELDDAQIAELLPDPESSDPDAEGKNT